MNNLLYSLKEELTSSASCKRLQNTIRVVDCRNIAELLFVVNLQWNYSQKTQWCTCRLAHMGPIAVIPFGLQEGFLLKTHGGPMMVA